MRLSFDLSPPDARRLQEQAAKLGLRPEDLACALVTDLLATPSEDFRQALEHVLGKNSELYRRLS